MLNRDWSNRRRTGQNRLFSTQNSLHTVYRDRVNRFQIRVGDTVVKVIVRDKETIQEAVRRFGKLVMRSGLKKEMRRRKYYEKPSDIKRRAKVRAQRRALKTRIGQLAKSFRGTENQCNCAMCKKSLAAPIILPVLIHDPRLLGFHYSTGLGLASVIR